MPDPFTSSDGPDLVRLADDLRVETKRDAAAAQLFELLNEFLVSRIAEHISDRFRGKVSEESVVQEMWQTFCRRRAHGEYAFDDSDDVRGLLFTIARNKLIDRIRRLNARKRNPDAANGGGGASSSSLDSDSADNAGERNNVEGGMLAVGRPLAAPERIKRGYGKNEMPPVPEILNLADEPGDEWLGELLSGADGAAVQIVAEKVAPLDDDLKTVLRFKLAGHTLEEIAAKTNRTLKQVRLKMEAIQEAFQDLYDDSVFGMDAPKQRPKVSP